MPQFVRDRADVAGVRPVIADNHRMPARLCVLVMPIAGPKEFYPDAHIAGVRDGVLVVAGGPARRNGLDPIIDVRREIPLTEVHRVELLDEDDDEE
jgi:hypothetical protein